MNKNSKNLNKWRAKNPDKFKEQLKRYYKKHKKEIIMKQKKRRKEWKKSHPKIIVKGWKDIRASILKRDNNTCQYCGKAGKEVHYINGEKYRFSTKPKNLITLCHRCHVKTEKIKSDNFHRNNWSEDKERTKVIMKLTKKFNQSQIGRLFNISRQRISQIILK